MAMITVKDLEAVQLTVTLRVYQSELKVSGMRYGSHVIELSAPCPENLGDIRDEVSDLVSRGVDALVAMVRAEKKG